MCSEELGNNSEYGDVELKCEDCGQPFIFTAGEQQFYAEKNFQNQPKRCKVCRDARKQRTHNEMFHSVCAQCGREAVVPFKPTEGRPVYCSECFAQMRNSN